MDPALILWTRPFLSRRIAEKVRRGVPHRQRLQRRGKFLGDRSAWGIFRSPKLSKGERDQREGGMSSCPLRFASALLGQGRVLARQGWEGEKAAFCASCGNSLLLVTRSNIEISPCCASFSLAYSECTFRPVRRRLEVGRLPCGAPRAEISGASAEHNGAGPADQLDIHGLHAFEDLSAASDSTRHMTAVLSPERHSFIPRQSRNRALAPSRTFAAHERQRCHRESSLPRLPE